MKLVTQIAALFVAGMLVVGCGKDEKKNTTPAAPSAAELRAAEERATLEYFTKFFTSKTQTQESLLTTTIATEGSRTARTCCGEEVLVLGEIRLKADKTFVVNILPAMPPADDHDHHHHDGEEHGHDHEHEHGAEEVAGQWKIEGKELILVNVGKLAQAKHENKDIAVATFTTSVGTYDLTAQPVRFGFETRQLPVDPPAVAPARVMPPAAEPQVQQPPLTPAQIQAITRAVQDAGVTLLQARQVVNEWVAQAARFSYEYTRDTILELIERARQLRQ